jgi:hypothetical protein
VLECYCEDIECWNVTVDCATNMWSVGQVHCGYIAAMMALSVRATLRLYYSTDGTVCTCQSTSLIST